jgi:hypothetical protein
LKANDKINEINKNNLNYLKAKSKEKLKQKEVYFKPSNSRPRNFINELKCLECANKIKKLQNAKINQRF